MPTAGSGTRRVWAARECGIAGLESRRVTLRRRDTQHNVARERVAGDEGRRARAFVEGLFERTVLVDEYKHVGWLPQPGDRVSDLPRRKFLGEIFRHQRHAEGLDAVDVFAKDDGIFAFGHAQGEAVGRFAGQQTA